MDKPWRLFQNPYGENISGTLNAENVNFDIKLQLFINDGKFNNKWNLPELLLYLTERSSSFSYVDCLDFWNQNGCFWTITFKIKWFSVNPNYGKVFTLVYLSGQDLPLPLLLLWAMVWLRSRQPLVLVDLKTHNVSVR